MCRTYLELMGKMYFVYCAKAIRGSFVHLDQDSHDGSDDETTQDTQGNAFHPHQASVPNSNPSSRH